jgi:4-hydroxy-tetrahydrodipicolinate synthase
MEQCPRKGTNFKGRLFMFTGSYVAIVTPFKNGKIDEEAYKKMIEMHAAAGTDGIVPCGTTGESATLSHEEHKHLIDITVNKRMKVMAGTGSNNTAEAIELTKSAERAGVDGALLIAPYYNKPTQKGLYEHFKAIAEAVKIPLVPYNIISRTAINIATETMVKLSKIPNIVGVKEASGDLSQMTDVIRCCGPDFDVLSGDDALLLPLLAVGGKGVISVVANIVPKDVKALITAFNSGDIKQAQEINNKLFPLVKAMFIETNPIPVKTALSLMGIMGTQMRLPMTEMEEANKEKLIVELKNYGLIK